ncbi:MULTISPECIES: site-specific integrase [unclassified Chryseobacterium]|uniref:site-specific integrase n=1 Tax=unclassified Chryseobacterium TaxID=2593645 RepID=UPI000D3DBF71|nr:MULTISPECIES: site-specific integrase [unclassified Chryseobacterium]PTT68723.1 recombinase [Chryseobacterium sp. HMWF001]PVV54100.1 site-specific integrase [Chryseobacterium sp. HMWF035]
MQTYSLLFYAKKAKNNPELSTIYMRITVAGSRTEISTGQTVKTSQWSIKSGKVSGNSPNAKQLNSLLERFRTKLFECYNNLFNEGKEITCENLRNKYLGIEERKVTLIEAFKDHNSKIKELIGREFSKGTWKRYETSLRHTQAFLKWKYIISDIDVRHINPGFVADYEFYLRTVRNCSNNSAVKYIRNFQKIINICLNNEWMSKNPFIGYKSKIESIDVRFLTDVQLQKIREKNFNSDRLRIVRDIFVFCCYTGLAYIDVKNLTRDKITKGIDGGLWIKTKRVKTKIEASIPLLPEAQKILSRYENHPKSVNENTVLPVLSNQKMNGYLKEIGDLCEIDFDITFHTARHTFATTVTLNNGVPLETVSKMLGHANIRMTQHYAKIQDKKIGEDMSVLKKILIKGKKRSVLEM